MTYTSPKHGYTEEWGSATELSVIDEAPLFERFRQFQPHGTIFQVGYVVANVMDHEGTKYNLMRQWKNFATDYVMVSRMVEGAPMAQDVFGKDELYHGRASNELIYEGGERIEIKPYVPEFPEHVEKMLRANAPGGLANREAFAITLTHDTIRWSDAGGKVELAFEPIGPMLEVSIPGKLEHCVYRTQPYRVTGTISGTEVTGFGVNDYAYGAPGNDFIQSKIYSLLEQYWFIWMNEFEDGSYDCGIFMDGIDEFRAVYYIDDGDVVIPSESDLAVTHSKDGNVEHARFLIDNLEFEFVCDGRVRQIPSHVAWASGKLLRTDEERTPVRSFAWAEFFPAGFREQRKRT